MKPNQVTDEVIHIHCPFCGVNLHTKYKMRVRWIPNCEGHLEPAYVDLKDKRVLPERELKAIREHLIQQSTPDSTGQNGASCLDYCGYALLKLYGLTSESLSYA